MKIAITGTIGSGKTTVCDYIRSKGYDVFDCDKCNSELLYKGNLGYLAVKKTFSQVFDGEELNKAKLAEIVFKNDSAKQELEGIMHPLIYNKMAFEMINKDLFIAEVPLLFEANWDVYFDLIILVVSDYDLALKRLVNRGLTYEDAKSRLDNQLKVEDKLKRSDEIIYNNGDLSALFVQVDKLLDKYVR